MTKPEQANSSSWGSRITALGDSITWGYPDGRSWTQILAKEVKVSVHNAGVNRDTLEGMLSRLENDVIATSPDLCILMGGSNDVAQGYSLTEMQENARKIETRLEEAGIKVHFGLPIPIAVAPAFEVQLQAFRNWLMEFTKFVIPFQECFLLEGDIRRDLLSDGVHPTPDGYRLMAERAIEYFRKL